MRGVRPRALPRVLGWLLLGSTVAAIFGSGVPALGGAVLLARSSTSCTAGSGFLLIASPSTGTAPLPVQFTVDDPNGPPTFVVWNFGDGQGYSGNTSALLDPGHVYSAVGTFSVVVNVTQGTEHDSCTTTIVVSPGPLSVQISANPATGPVPLTVHFSARLSGGSGTFQSALWTFGDGNSATGFNVTYTYTSPGRYPAILTLVDSSNQSARANLTVTAQSAQTPGNVSSNATGGLSVTELALILLVVLGVVGALGIWGVRRSRSRSIPDEGVRTAPSSTEGPEPVPMDQGAPVEEDLEGPVGPTGPPAPTPSREPSWVTTIPAPQPEAKVVAVPEPEAPTSASRVPSEAPTGPLVTPKASRAGLKLSQRVLLHLYQQGHLADGEVAPMGFTQGGMAERLEVGQSPLSSVLRRLVVAGLVVQDTRHVRGQPRRLRVYRLSPLGDSVARDLYHRRNPTEPPTG